VQAGKKLVNIPASAILHVEAYGDYSKLHTKEDIYLSNFGISLLEEKLKPDIFIRIHRSSIININFVKEVIKYPSTYQVLMQNDVLLSVSRGYMDNLKRLMF
jgi:two-component system LytT family response regulator